MRVLILTGGKSSERKVSLISAKNVKKALEENGHKVLLYDLINGYEPIVELSKNFDVLFPVLHGEEGEGGKLHKFLADLNKLIVGTRNYKGMQNGWYKIPFKKFCDKNGIKTSPWKIVKSKHDILNFGFPSVLKASSGGSSREVVILKSKKDINQKTVKNLLKSKNIFIEKYFPGIEITVGVLNGKALPILQIIPALDNWFSYKTKYDISTKEIPNPKSVDIKLQNKIKDITLKIHNAFDLGTYSRTDFIISDGTPYALELNTIPGLTSESLLPKQAKAARISFGEFLEILLNTAK